MSSLKGIAIIFCCALACVIFLPNANASEWDQMTNLTFNQPVEIPGKVLPAGSYWFVLTQDTSDRNVVQIFNKNWTKLDATLLTAPTIRKESTNRTEVKFAERPHDKPEAMLKWFYPGRLTGHEFLYASSKREKEFTRDPKVYVLAGRTIVASAESPTRP